MPKQRFQSVGVFVDVQNLYYSAKQFYNSKVNFAHLLARAVSGRQLIRAIAYVIKADIKEEENFFEALEKIGYDVKSKDLQTFYGGAKKGDWDVGIAMDIMRMASKLDVIVLVSGDGDFKDLVEHVKSLGCRAEVIAFKKTVSSRLLDVTDEFTDLDRELDKILIKRQQKKFIKPFVKNSFKEPQHEPLSLLQKVNMDQPMLPKLVPDMPKPEQKQEEIKDEPEVKVTKKVKKKK